MQQQQTKVKMDFDQVFIFLYCLFITLRLSDAEECRKFSRCFCNTTKAEVNLQAITTVLEVKNLGYTYQFQPCTGLKEECEGHAGDTVAACQRADSGKNIYDVGDIDTGAFSGDPLANTLQLKYNTTGEKNSIFAIRCDRNVDGKLTSVKEGPTNTYTFNFNTKFACFGSSGGSGSKKISTGSVLLIIFFLFLGIYFIAGLLFLKFARGAQGTEMVPNYDFWTSLPGLIKDGIMFTCRGCKTESSYSQI